MTRVPVEFWGVGPTVGTIERGRQADLTLIDPEALRSYDSDANMAFGDPEAIAAKQMPNRSDRAVTEVRIAGSPAWRNARATGQLGATRMGSALTVRTST